MTEASAGAWYARTVLRVRDAPQSLGFYIGKLGFKEDWRYEDDGRLRVVQVSRQGCELILSDQWPEAAGGGLLFVSLDPPDFAAMTRELSDRGVRHASGRWGYDLVVVEDPDGNRLWFPHPEPAGA
jgi:catechol 2,3-dioxygenase-like lactoylglutathione lyase family enzyme